VNTYLVLADESVSQHYGESFAALVTAPLVVYLFGELGAGKTFFTRAVLRGLGYQDAVKSPTYTLVESYPLARFHLHHFDLYRITDAQELEFIGLDTYFGKDSVVFIEWPSHGEGVLPQPDIVMEFHYRPKGRELKIEAKSARGEAILEQFQSV